MMECMLAETRQTPFDCTLQQCEKMCTPYGVTSAGYILQGYIRCDIHCHVHCRNIVTEHRHLYCHIQHSK